MVAEQTVKYLENKEPNVKINANDFLTSNADTVTNDLYDQLVMVRFQCANVKYSFIDIYFINKYSFIYFVGKSEKHNKL